MKFFEINISASRTVLLNFENVLMIERTTDGLAVITLSNGDVYVTNEFYDELIDNL